MQTQRIIKQSDFMLFSIGVNWLKTQFKLNGLCGDKTTPTDNLFFECNDKHVLMGT